MGQLARDEFEPALLRLIAPWLAGPGHAGDRLRHGRQPSGLAARRPIARCPARRSTRASLVTVPTRDRGIAVQLVPGLKQVQPADVMRGEETQIAGALALMPGFDGVLCLPGTHSKWVHVSAGEVVSFQTYMTGEMFALLSEHSVLRHGMTGRGLGRGGLRRGVVDACRARERIAARLFALRAEGLARRACAAARRARGCRAC